VTWGMSEVFRRLLKDYPFNEWLEAADGCDVCGARYQVRVVEVDETGVFGSLEWRITHSPGCPGSFDEETGEEVSSQSGEDVVGWEFTPEPFTFMGRQYYPLKSRANVGPCLECGRLVVGVPLILFIDGGEKGELDFCWKCARKLGITRLIKR